MIRSAATAALVIAAMGLGRVITDHVPLDESADQPFVHTADAGDTVSLEYADVTVTGFHVTPTIIGDPAAASGGRWLVVDTELVATREPTRMLGFFLLDGQDRRYASSSRGSECAINAGLDTGVRWYGSFCFDVPKAALDGTRLVVTRGDYSVNGSGFRRDDVAEIDLGLRPGDTDGLWSQRTPVDVKERGVTPPGQAPR